MTLRDLISSVDEVLPSLQGAIRTEVTLQSSCSFPQLPWRQFFFSFPSLISQAFSSFTVISLYSKTTLKPEHFPVTAGKWSPCDKKVIRKVSARYHVVQVVFLCAPRLRAHRSCWIRTWRSWLVRCGWPNKTPSPLWRRSARSRCWQQLTHWPWMPKTCWMQLTRHGCEPTWPSQNLTMQPFLKQTRERERQVHCAHTNNLILFYAVKKIHYISRYRIYRLKDIVYFNTPFLLLFTACAWNKWLIIDYPIISNEFSFQSGNPSVPGHTVHTTTKSSFKKYNLCYRWVAYFGVWTKFSWRNFRLSFIYILESN